MEHIFNTIKPQFVCKMKPEHLIPHTPDLDIEEAIRTEPQFFNATPDFVQHYKGETPITSKVLRRLRNLFFQDDSWDEEYYHLVVNSYCHKMPRDGLYASIPGWHCDYSKQEDEEVKTRLEEHECVRHWVFILGTNNPPTYQFLDKYNIHINDFKLEEPSWKEVSKHIDRKVASGWKTKTAKLNEILEFRGNELYRTMPTENPCWRYQLKVTHYPNGHVYRPTGTQGKVRQLQMVYLDCDGKW